MWTAYLMLLGFGTLVYLLIRCLIRFPIPGKADGPGLRGMGTRIRESILHTLAWLTVGTLYLIVGDDKGMVLGAALVTCSCLLFIRQCRHYTRWRALCLRRESGGRRRKPA